MRNKARSGLREGRVVQQNLARPYHLRPLYFTDLTLAGPYTWLSHAAKSQKVLALLALPRGMSTTPDVDLWVQVVSDCAAALPLALPALNSDIVPLSVAT